MAARRSWCPDRRDMIWIDCNPQAGREMRVMVEPEQINDAQAEELAGQISKRIQEEMEYPGQIKVTIIRECRYTEYAK